MGEFLWRHVLIFFGKRLPARIGIQWLICLHPRVYKHDELNHY
jgi:hypothetical protein